jgi:zinc finger protein CreA/MIG
MNSQDESYARPTSVVSSRQHYSRQYSQIQYCQRPSVNSTAIAKLSDVAMNELYSLEQQENLRHAECQARHAEYQARQADILRLAEIEARQSAEASEPGNNDLVKHGPISYHPRSTIMDGNKRTWISGDPAWFRGLAGKEKIHQDRMKHRTSGPILQMTPLPDDTPKASPSSGYLLDATNPHLQLVRGSPHGSDFRQDHGLGLPGLSSYPVPHKRKLLAHEGSPSPTSSDSESPPRSTSHSPSDALLIRPHFAHAPPSRSGQTYHPVRTAESSYTPSTSPFLAPLRTLTINSNTPSRVPSPILLAPCSLVGGSGTEATIEGSASRSGGSPDTDIYNSSVAKRKPPHRDAGSRHVYAHSVSPFSRHPLHLGERSLPPLPTSISSETSSGGSSPSNFSYSSGSLSSAWLPVRQKGTLSATGSRPSSPTCWSHIPTSPLHRRVNSSSGLYVPHNNIAHSVRMAFGVDPIYSESNTSRPFSSMPPSRSASPPITLPPLKIPTLGSTPHGMDGYEGRRVELPSFRQFTAAARVPAP